MMKFFTRCVLGLCFFSQLVFAQAEEVIVITTGVDRATFTSGSPLVRINLDASVLAAADAGPEAAIPTGFPFPLALWGSYRPSPTARHISTSDAAMPPNSAVYAIKFNVETTDIESATFEMDFYADDSLGDPDQAGVYINSISNPVPNTMGIQGRQARIEPQDITGFLTPGENTLYLYSRDLAAIVAGIIASATITVTARAVPPAPESIPVFAWPWMMTMVLLIVTFVIGFRHKKRL